jgi:glutathione peroxidase
MKHNLVATSVVLGLALAACGGSATITADRFPKEAQTAVPNLYDLKAPSLDAGDVDLGDYRGKVTLVVNVASECGYTPQYEGLQALHEELSPRGFAVLGFPCNEFLGQEPGTAEEIREFCSTKFHVTFPMFAKVDVKPGASQSPVYAYLTTATGQVPGWNFSKYLVGKDGRARAFFGSRVTPDDPKLRQAIEAALAE